MRRLPHTLGRLKVLTKISSHNKEDESKAHLKEYNILRQDPDNIIAYTEGSMMDKAVGAGLTICDGLPVVEEESIPTGRRVGCGWCRSRPPGRCR